MLKQTRTSVHGTIGEFISTLVAGQRVGTEQEKVYKALAVLESNGLMNSTQVERFKDEYANGDYVVEASDDD